MRSPFSENLLSGEVGSVNLKEFFVAARSAQNSQYAVLTSGLFDYRQSNHKKMFRIASSVKKKVLVCMGCQVEGE